MKKNYLLDTNVLLHDPSGALHAFDEHDVYVPMRAIEEIDNKKHDPNLGYHARVVSRELEQLFDSSSETLVSAPTQTGGRVFIDLNGDKVEELPSYFEPKADNMILLAAQRLDKKLPGGIILISKDTNLRLKARKMGIRAEDYRYDRTDPTSILYTGLVTIPVEEVVIHSFSRGSSSEMPREIPVNTDGIPGDMVRTLHPNACCRLVTEREHQCILAIYDYDRQCLKYVKKPTHRVGRDGVVYPRNNEQCFAYDMVFDPSIELVTLVGNAGTGKTLIGLLAGLDALIKRMYEKIIVIRPTEEVGRPMGFLPGTLEEKFGPHAAPILSRLKFLSRGRNGFVDELLREGRIDIRPINYVRGDTFDNSLLFVDEAQNLTPHDVKTIITRAGRGAKVVLNGDPAQIDTPFLDPLSNGLVHVVARGVNPKVRLSWYAHLKLTQGERSRLAEEAARLF